MASFTATVFSSLSAEQAFAYLADVRSFDEWDPGIKRAEQTAGTGPGLGAEYRLKYGFFSLDYEVVEFEPARHLRMVSDSTMLSSKDTIDFVETDVGSTVTYTADVQLPAPLRFLDSGLQKALDRNGNKAADGLAVALLGERVYEEHETIDPAP